MKKIREIIFTVFLLPFMILINQVFNNRRFNKYHYVTPYTPTKNKNKDKKRRY